MGVYSPQGFEPATAQNIVKQYENVIEDLQQEFFSDYVDYFTFDPANPNVFTLKYIPAKGNLRFHVNGIVYDLDTYCSIDYSTKKIEWLFTKDNGGFDLRADFNLFAIYDIFYSENGLSGKSDIS